MGTEKRKIKAISKGRYAEAIIGSGAGKLGVAEHVFDNTIYVRVNNDLLLISAYRWRSPFTINVKLMEGESFKDLVAPLKEVQLEKDIISVGERLQVEIAEVPVYNDLGKPEAIDLRKEGLDKKLMLMLYTVGIIAGSLRDATSPYLNRKICEHLRNAKLLEEAAMESLIGLGEGFTPSGDDVYVGLASAMAYVSKYIEEYRITASSILMQLDKSLPGKLNRTTWASGMYVKYALRGMLDESVERLLYSFHFAEEDEFYSDLLRLINRGHESGVYIALGILVGLALIHKPNNSPWSNKLCSLISV